jgi:hypothetical protein
MQKGLQLSWLGGLSSTPQVLGLTPRGSEFQAGVKKKSPRLFHTKASHMGYGARGLSYPPQVEF